MNNSPSAPLHAVQSARSIGALVRQLRKDRHLTGTSLAQQAGLSQSRVSRIEGGHVFNRPDEIRSILNILDAPRTIRQQVDILFARIGEVAEKNYIAKYTFSSVERISQRESNAQSIRTFVFSGIPVLLQTMQYRRELLINLGADLKDLPHWLRALDERQAMMWQGEKAYDFLIHEAAMYCRVSNLGTLIAQLERLEHYLDLNRVSIGIIPMEAGLVDGCDCTLVLYDEAEIVREIGNETISSTDSPTVMQFLSLYTTLGSRAMYGTEAIKLIRKAEKYLSGSGAG